MYQSSLLKNASFINGQWSSSDTYFDVTNPFNNDLIAKVANADVIETQLAHKQGGVRAVYNQAEYLDDRRIMMQDWSNYLDNLQGNAPRTETSSMDGNIEKLKASIDRLTRS